MVYQVNRVVADVRRVLDQDNMVDVLIGEGDAETLLLDDIMRSKVVEAIDRVHSMAPYWLLEQGHNFADAAVYWFSGSTTGPGRVLDGCGWVLLPEDFLRLVVFEMDDWERPVYTPIGTDDPRYRRQRCRVAALRGTVQRPVCAVAVRPEGRVLEFYSCKSEAAGITKAVYVPRASVDDRDSVDISERCYDAVVYMAAALTMTACGEGDRAKGYQELAKSYLEK